MSNIHSPAYTVAVAHVAPVFLDTQATINKAIHLIAEASIAGARLIAFPETFVPAFPVWASLQAPIYNHKLFTRLVEQAVRVPDSSYINALSTAAKQYKIYVSIGINEGTGASVGCIWNSNLLFGDDGTLLNHHRKLVPTFWEKLSWANGEYETGKGH
jgi:nitrilase